MSMTTTETDKSSNSEIQKLPDITLPATHGEISLRDYLIGYRGVLAFYPADESPVCSNQLGIYNEALPIFRRYNARVVAISVDDVESHRKFADSLNLKFPLLADYDPFGKLSQKFNVYDEEKKRCQRAIFVFDEQGKLYWSQIYPDHVNPGAEGILKALDELKANPDC